MFRLGYLPIIGLFSLIAAFIVSIFYFVLHKPNAKKMCAFGLLVWVDFFYIVSASMILFKIRPHIVDGNISPLQGNYIPFKTIIDYVSNGNLIQTVGNILVTLPLPFIIIFTLSKIRLKTTIIISLIVTLLIEPVQLLINLLLNLPCNIIDIDDLILNLFGCGIGIILSKSVLSSLKKRQI